MTRAVVVYCHPKEGSYTSAIRDTVLGRLASKGAEVRVIDLYARAYDPTLSLAEWEGYLDTPRNREMVAEDVADLQWADTLIFIYPTWWYALPAVLKGWLDRTFLPDVAFLMPDGVNRTIRPGLTRIRRLGVFTTCGASWWLTAFVGAPGKRMLMRGIGLLCAPRPRRAFAAHYLMDSSTPESRARHLARVAAKTDRLIR
ncbi:MAG: NAD(P)H dehydrogenase [Rhodobacter sp.]|nr:NAD(P)H dehydrogenase [Rhodobacter sp.]